MCDVHTSLRPEIEAISTLVVRVNASLELDQVIDHATHVCTTLTGCAGALVYLWDEEEERLVVRGASEGYRDWIGNFSLALGEGLTGWTALNRRPGKIADDPLSDPRYKLVPELKDTHFQSVLTIPVVGRADYLVGVLTLHTTAPREFSDDDVALMQTVASLIAGAVENATLHRQALRSMEVFRSLADLSHRLTVGSRTAETLQRLALTALELLNASLVVILRADEKRRQLAVETWVGGDGGSVRLGAVPLEGVWSRLLGAGPTSVAASRDDPIARAAGLQTPARSLFTSPVVFEGRPTGLLACYSQAQRVLRADNLALLGTIANHVAIALEEDRLRAIATERSRLRELFDALRAGDATDEDIARALGPIARAPHAAVVVAEAGSGTDALSGSLARALPDAALDTRPRTVTAIVPLTRKDWSRWLEEKVEPALKKHGAIGGYSERTASIEGYPVAFRQARMACAIARTLSPRHRVCGYAGLGAQRHLWTISRELEADPLELALGRLLETDRGRGSQLFRTLEAYLEHQGNARAAAASLYVHRNTLRQRLQRIADLVGVDPTDPAARFDLYLAVRLVRFRETPSFFE